MKVRSSSSEFQSRLDDGERPLYRVCVCVCAGFLVRQRTRSRRLYRRRGEMCLIQTKETCAITLEKSAELKHPDPLVHLIDLTPPTTDNLQRRGGNGGMLFSFSTLYPLSLSRTRFRLPTRR